ncbi:menaquinone-dependent protoporphyrinogen IX dehydrogenase [Rhodobacteraceae bacterium RKSG542]|uniref:menaquinone-dependent protoporphyrinogen IX dehydrogenase n=1 Tax=Pseudovibrio flavus TaxID=2529854 RepID=UPI0012BCA88A|nr:menaquinone-dependent protoporphyrinogen IX dehydrogenase [Pseudovibrio flavus]MTI19047.1 menaquinone-dependent protoporphyrinogen IX dehydrogenase [Pseudovibrio flavus]
MQYSIYFATHDAHTKQIISKIQEHLEAAGHTVNPVELSSGKEPLAEWHEDHRIIVAVPIRYGFHLPAVRRFVKRNIVRLNSEQTAFISVNLTARKPNKNTAETNFYCRKYLERSGLEPKKAAVFAGMLNYPIYNIFDRVMIQLIMVITGGPTDASQKYEFTDWGRVDDFAQELADWDTPIFR